jgi:hypothetical protein
MREYVEPVGSHRLGHLLRHDGGVEAALDERREQRQPVRYRQIASLLGIQHLRRGVPERLVNPGADPHRAQRGNADAGAREVEGE